MFSLKNNEPPYRRRRVFNLKNNEPPCRRRHVFNLKNNEPPCRRRCKPQSNLLYTVLINLIGFPQEENKRKDQSVELGDYKEKPFGEVKD